MADLQPSGQLGSNNRLISCLQPMRRCCIADADGSVEQQFHNNTFLSLVQTSHEMGENYQ